ncbi:DUF6259 domain-containing protein [Desmospora activa]|uniref:DUF6259 domain-containing protein n=1 Tax=Desmospora activa DSM 45169 TaxID=1121389 RepID=A0A2T4ZD36_9BACL|nr:DUF6259 domain-containing protein [Desmospora activa]PTM59797.1 hypothetical protein C8J48_2429 [Desmospora activa DSM 45169]
MIQLENNRLTLRINKSNGEICGLYDKLKKKEYILSQPQSISFRLERGSGITTQYRHFSYMLDESTEEKKAVLTWEVEAGLTVTGTIIASSATEEFRFYANVTNETKEPVIGVEYPIIPDIQAITADGADDFVAHSFATGICIRNPLKHFESEGVGFRQMPYPEGFSGATMQFFSYYGLNQGGLYFAALDGDGYAKGLNFYKNESGLLEASFFHAAEDIGPQKGIKVEYPIVVQALEGEGWVEAADRYKEWAVQQFWCRKGVLAKRDKDDYAPWLYEEMGAATFGINAMHDRSRWIDRYHDYIQTPLFHILGPDWVNQRQNFYNGVPGGMDDWFPTRFHPHNIQTLQSYGDKYAPFEFDYLYNIYGADGERGRKALQKFPEGESLRSIDKYQFPLICPVAPYTQDFHVRRDERLQEEADVDSIYYDISANNILKVCLDDSHGHPVGAGKQVTMAYRQNYGNTKAAMIKKAGRYIPMGTEMMNEVFLDVLDYYQARAGGRPAAPLEGWNFRELLIQGEAELIPMFTYVYHEYGALRLDGWGKLVEEIGSLFYFTVARTYLWGGLYELNHEYSPMEVVDGKENERSEHYYLFEARGYRLSPERARYLGKFARLRTGSGNQYLAYGKMLRPLSVPCERIKVDWFHYNHSKGLEDYNQSGKYEVDAIVHSGWQFQNECLAFFFANVTDEQAEVSIDLDMKKYVLPPGRYQVRKMVDDRDMEPLFVIEHDNVRKVEFNIPGKSVVMLEVIKAEERKGEDDESIQRLRYGLRQPRATFQCENTVDQCGKFHR